eukprot:scaffold69313_cov66-Phaeocystis_antarctica.AAC.4
MAGGAKRRGIRRSSTSRNTMTPGSSSCNWRLVMAHWSCPVLQMWLLRPQGAQKEVVAIALAEKQLWWLHRACVTQNRDRSCKEELVHDHTNRNQHTS